MDQEIDLAKLKETYRADPLTYHIWSVAADCKVRSRAFWQHFVRMKRRHNWISVPLLVLSSGTGVSSVAQIGGGNGAGAAQALSVLVTVLGVSVAILTALQRYLRYSERAEEARYMARSFARIARTIQYNMTLVESRAISFKPEAFVKFFEGIHKDMDTLLGETKDLPKELLSRREKLLGWLGLKGARSRRDRAPSPPRVCIEKASGAESDAERDAERDYERGAAAREFDDWVRTPPGMSAMAPEREPARTPARLADAASPSVDARYQPVTLDRIKEELSLRAARDRDRSRSRSRSPRPRRSTSDSY
jgi:hypothetical protein